MLEASSTHQSFSFEDWLTLLSADARRIDGNNVIGKIPLFVLQDWFEAGYAPTVASIATMRDAA